MHFCCGLRLFHSQSYYNNGDYNRDYLIAHHILEYGEYPLVGPEGAFGHVSNSPIYFYLLALPLLFQDNIIFLGFFNIVLQMGVLALVYVIARRMVGKPTAIIAAFFLD